jgi:hypothetical protein
MVDFRGLDIEFENTCMLAQQHGTYSAGRRKLFGHGVAVDANAGAADYGFYAYAALGAKDLRSADVRYEYHELTMGWLEVVKDRRRMMAAERLPLAA